MVYRYLGEFCRFRTETLAKCCREYKEAKHVAHTKQQQNFSSLLQSIPVQCRRVVYHIQYLLDYLFVAMPADNSELLREF